MKKRYLFLMPIIPVLVGWLHNWLLYITMYVPMVLSIVMYLLPLVMVIVWLMVGRQFAASGLNIVASTLLGNSLGIVSLCIYLWDRLGMDAANSISFLVGFSQMFNACSYKFIIGFAYLFEPHTFIAMQIFALLFMMLIFIIGFLSAKKKKAVTNTPLQ